MKKDKTPIKHILNYNGTRYIDQKSAKIEKDKAREDGYFSGWVTGVLSTLAAFLVWLLKTSSKITKRAEQDDKEMEVEYTEVKTEETVEETEQK